MLCEREIKKIYFNGLLLKRKRTKVVHKSKSMSKGFKVKQITSIDCIKCNKKELLEREREREIILGYYTWVTY